MITVEGKSVTIIGAAKSGLAAAALLRRKGADVFVTDAGKISMDDRLFLNTLQISWEDGGHTERAKECMFAVISPGVPTEANLVQYFLNNEIDVFSEIEVASWYCKSPIVAITGSNGKTTVTTWIAHTFEQAKKRYIMAGNIGIAFSSIVEQTSAETTVILEVSSFQLDHIKTFKPKVAVLLNITPDHLNRYKYNMDLYAQAKYRIFENQDETDVLVYGVDDPLIHIAIEKAKDYGKKINYYGFSSKAEVESGVYVENNAIVYKKDEKKEVLMPTSELGLSGQHNLSNGLATAIATRASEIGNESIRESLSRFQGVEHRLEFVREVNGVRYINDSKATNVNSVWFAIDSFQVPMVLILGGRDKGNDYSELNNQIKEKVHTIIAIGESKHKVKDQLSEVVPNLIEVETMDEAVIVSQKKAKRGEVVLLSPACASFDMFESYEHRGRVFKKLVQQL
ncbi:MAG: UDP-N-acetylmuramoyl-L-alanine--D-glutamate ligase [Bacteroidetes bacterium]|nr:UDP-N-acetylmuramoyl-L-alanine--D-glutamate ligase [Bacteroidota bacterium]